MAKLGLTTLALGAGTAAILTLSSARSAETPKPPAKEATAPVAVTKDPKPAAEDLKPAGTDADVRRRLADEKSVFIKDTPLPVVAEILTKVAGVRVVLSAELKNPASRRVTLEQDKVPLKNILDNLTRVNDLVWSIQKATIVIGPKPAEGAISDDSEVQVALTKKVTFEFADTRLSEAVDFMGQLAKVKITISPDAIKNGSDKTPVNLRVQDMELGLALDWILRLAGLESRIEKGGIVVDLPRQHPSVSELLGALTKLKAEAQERSAADALTDISRMSGKFTVTTDALIALKDKKLSLGKFADGREIVAEILKDRQFACSQRDDELTLDLRQIPEWENAMLRGLQRKVTFDFTETPTEDALSFLNQLTRINLIIDPAVMAAGKLPAITLKVKDETIASALAKLLDAGGLACDFRNQAVFISTKEKFPFPADLTRVPPPEKPVEQPATSKPAEKPAASEF